MFAGRFLRDNDNIYWDLDVLPPSSLAAWWSLHPKASKISEITIGAVTDVSGNGISLQNAGGGQPVLNATGINGFNCLQSSGSEYLTFAIPSLANQTDITFAAVTTPAYDGIRKYGIGLGSQGLDTSGIRWGLFGEGNLSTDGVGWAGSTAGNANIHLGSGSLLTPNVPIISIYRKTATGWTISVNGSVISAVADTSKPTGTFNGILFREQKPIYAAVARFGEIAILQGSDTSDIIQRIEGIWANRWQIALPFTHPYLSPSKR